MDIKIFNSTITFAGMIDNYESCFATLVHGDASSASITIKTNKNNANKLTKGSWFYVDDDREKLFIITEEPKQYDEKGKTVSVTAKNVIWLAAGRLSNTMSSPITYTAKTVEYIVKDLLSKALVNAADADRNISFIEIAANEGRGSTINVTINQTQLDADIITLLAIDRLGIKWTLDADNKKVIIDIYEGADRSVGNAQGNSPVIFDFKFDNVRSGEENNGNTNVKNYAYVLGVNSTGTRVIGEYGTATGVSRRETAVDAGNTDDLTEMQAYGKAATVTEENSYTFSVDVLGGPFKFGVDYFLGDIVTIMGQNLRVVQAEPVWEAGKQFGLNITFGQIAVTTEKQTRENTNRIGALEAKVVNNSRFDVGDVFISTNSTSPATRFGGVWTRIKDKFILASGDIFTAGSTGGAAAATLAKANLPQIQLNVGYQGGNNLALNTGGSSYSLSWGLSGLGGEIRTEYLGSGTPFSILPPYYAVYVWMRTA